MEASKLRLWEIASELDVIGELIADAGGELSPDMEARLDAMEGALEEKVERIALFVRECEANEKAAAFEVERLQAIGKSFERKAAGLKGYLHRHLQRIGKTKVETARARVRVQQNSRPSIRWMSTDQPPAPYLKTQTVTTTDTALAYEEWKAGNELPAGFVVEQGSHLRIT